MPHLKFAANLSTMFNDVNMYDRFEVAQKKGFGAAEAQFLYDYDINKLSEAQKTTLVEVVLINSPFEGNTNLHGYEQFGIACIPGEEVEFIRTIQKATVYASTLKCKIVHVIAGMKIPGFDEDDLHRTYINNLKVAVEMLEEHNLIAVIEPMCAQVRENYFLNSFEQAKNCIEEVGSENLKLLLDVYHMHMMGLNVEEEIEKYLKYAAHVQVSQAPNRNEPGFPGEINYDNVFKILEVSNYTGYIGLEYTPSDSPDNLKWIEPFSK